MRINMVKSEVIKCGNEILQCTSDFDTNIKKMTAIIDSINQAWDGADALKYINTLKEKYIPDLIELKEIIEDYGTYLCKIPQAYTMLDDDFANKKM